MIKTSLASILLLLALFFQACSKNDNNNDSNANSIIVKNEYVLTGLDKKQYIVIKEANGYTLKGAKGKVIIFDIFATWCPPCQATAPHLSSLQKKYKDDLVVIGVTIERNLPNTKLQDFRAENGADYTLVNSPQNRRLVNSITESLNLGAQYPIPIMAIYKDGELVQKYIGLVEEEFVESDIKVALGL